MHASFEQLIARATETGWDVATTAAAGGNTLRITADGSTAVITTSGRRAHVAFAAPNGHVYYDCETCDCTSAAHVFDTLRAAFD